MFRLGVSLYSSDKFVYVGVVALCSPFGTHSVIVSYFCIEVLQTVVVFYIVYVHAMI